jgi:uncharacterized membrane protein YfcA
VVPCPALQALITAGSVVSVLLNLFKRSPLSPSAPLIDFHVAVVLTPVVLAGVSVGVILNQLFPAWLITVLLTLLMAFLVVQSMSKGGWVPGWVCVALGPCG